MQHFISTNKTDCLYLHTHKNTPQQMKKGTLTNLFLLHAFLLLSQVEIKSDTVIQTNAPVKLNQCLVTKDGRIRSEERRVGKECCG